MAEPDRVLVVDDDEAVLRACREALEQSGWVVESCTDPAVGRDLALRGPFAVVLLDLGEPDAQDLDRLARIKERRADLEVLIMTDHPSFETAVRAVKLGAYDYLPKPFTPEELTARVAAAVGAVRARRAPATEAGELHPGAMVGDSPAMVRVRALIERLAPSDATVLIIGESGTGKELVAAAIHEASPRRDKPFVSIDCSALAPGLLESELFGHVKGAFTGAAASKPGLLEVADKGTVLLDEVGNLTLETQGKLLRVLETSEIRPVGGLEIRKVDIRLVAATNRDLADGVRDGTFRGDLYHRLNVLPIRLPALRERGADVRALANHFLAQLDRSGKPGPRRFNEEALDALQRYSWPGNVRELRNLVERLVVTVDGDCVRPDHLPDYFAAPDAPAGLRVPVTNDELKALKRTSRERSDSQLERLFVIEALRRNDWRVTRAAEETGMLRPNFHALMRKHGIRVQDLKD